MAMTVMTSTLTASQPKTISISSTLPTMSSTPNKPAPLAPPPKLAPPELPQSPTTCNAPNLVSKIAPNGSANANADYISNPKPPKSALPSKPTLSTTTSTMTNRSSMSSPSPNGPNREYIRRRSSGRPGNSSSVYSSSAAAAAAYSYGRMDSCMTAASGMSLASFTSMNSFGSTGVTSSYTTGASGGAGGASGTNNGPGSGGGNGTGNGGSSANKARVVELGNLRFLTEDDPFLVQNGKSPILGKGSFAMVRLARRKTPMRRLSVVSDLSQEMDGNVADNAIGDVAVGAENVADEKADVKDYSNEIGADKEINEKDVGLDVDIGNSLDSSRVDFESSNVGVGGPLATAPAFTDEHDLHEEDQDNDIDDRNSMPPPNASPPAISSIMRAASPATAPLPTLTPSLSPVATSNKETNYCRSQKQRHSSFKVAPDRKKSLKFKTPSSKHIKRKSNQSQSMRDISPTSTTSTATTNVIGSGFTGSCGMGGLGFGLKKSKSLNHAGSFNDSLHSRAQEDEGELVAVKIFQKSILKQCKTLERISVNSSNESASPPHSPNSPSSPSNESSSIKQDRLSNSSSKSKPRSNSHSHSQLLVHTALENVEREIALMKMIQHPNLVCLHEVIDSAESDRLYMVIEYVMGGEIMTHVRGTNRYERRISGVGIEGETERRRLGVNERGYFDERHAALYFVDIIHGLAHLHRHHIVHRDLKPENILLDPRGFAKISDFGVSHLFEDEMSSVKRASIKSTSSTIESSQTMMNSSDIHGMRNYNSFNGVDSTRNSDLGGLESMRFSRKRLSRAESDAALQMKPMPDRGMLTKTEGTWCFWSPEMCAENSLIFSGYACDLWAAGVCLYIFATGRLPFFSEIPLVLYDMIAAANVELDGLGLSDTLIDLLKKVMAKDPAMRAGVGDCLKHPFCVEAREQRIRELGDEVEKNDDEIVVQHDDLRQAFSTTRKSSARALADNLSRRLQLMRKRLSTRSTASSKSMSLEEVDEEESSRSSRRLKLSFSQNSLVSRSFSQTNSSPPASGGLIGHVIDEEPSSRSMDTEDGGDCTMSSAQLACVIQ